MYPLRTLCRRLSGAPCSAADDESMLTAHDLEKFQKLKWHGMRGVRMLCICICPARRPLTQAFKEMRKAVCSQPQKVGGGKKWNKLLNVSSSPHVRDGVTTQRLMFDVVIAMIPASVYGVWQFGMNALLVLIATVIASVVSRVSL